MQPNLSGLTYQETHMAKRYPGASYEPLGRQTEARMTAHDIICLHTMVGTLTGTDSMFERDGFGGTESHFGTGGGRGEVKQWQDLTYQADANLEGGPRVISIENADIGPGFPKWGGSDVPAFTDAQVDELVDLVAWLCSKEAHAECPSTWRCHREGIPARFVDSRPGQRGISTHRQGCDGNFPNEGPLAGRVNGGEKWSLSRGKVCPGDRRIMQTVDTIIPRVQARLSQEDDMPYLDWPKKDRDALVRDVVNGISWSDIFPGKRRMSVKQAVRFLIWREEKRARAEQAPKA